MTHARLGSLLVTGGEGMYPEFDPGVLHYAVRCADGTVLQVAAQAQDGDATLRLPHSDRTATGAVEATVTVNSDHDLAIEVGGGPRVTTYVVHCIPPDFPDIVIEKRTGAVSEGRLLMTPGVRQSDKSFLAIVDNNGVPRRVMRPNVRARNFRRYPGGRYSFSERAPDRTEAAVILDADFNRIDTAALVGNLLPEHTGGHDFLITENGTYLLMSYYPAERDLSAFEQCRDADGSSRQCSASEPAGDSVIQEVTPDGGQVLLWNSWEHVKIADCTVHRFPNDYAHLNSLHELEGDIVAGLRGCAQVLRIERATGAVVWQLGGTLPMRTDRPPPSSGATEYLDVVGDPGGEFCGQHSLTHGDGHRLYDANFRHLRTVTMPGRDPHDFLITEDDTVLFMGYKRAVRDASHITDPDNRRSPFYNPARQRRDHCGTDGIRVDVVRVEFLGSPEHPGLHQGRIQGAICTDQRLSTGG